jgi:hypothetical protein
MPAAFGAHLRALSLAAPDALPPWYRLYLFGTGELP